MAGIRLERAIAGWHGFRNYPQVKEPDPHTVLLKNYQVLFRQMRLWRLKMAVIKPWPFDPKNMEVLDGIFIKEGFQQGILVPEENYAEAIRVSRRFLRLHLEGEVFRELTQTFPDQPNHVMNTSYGAGTFHLKTNHGLGDFSTPEFVPLVVDISPGTIFQGKPRGWLILPTAVILGLVAVKIGN